MHSSPFCKTTDTAPKTFKATELMIDICNSNADIYDSLWVSLLNPRVKKSDLLGNLSMAISNTIIPVFSGVLDQ